MRRRTARTAPPKVRCMGAPPVAKRSGPPPRHHTPRSRVAVVLLRRYLSAAQPRPPRGGGGAGGVGSVPWVWTRGRDLGLRLDRIEVRLLGLPRHVSGNTGVANRRYGRPGVAPPQHGGQARRRRGGQAPCVAFWRSALLAWHRATCAFRAYGAPPCGGGGGGGGGGIGMLLHLRQRCVCPLAARRRVLGQGLERRIRRDGRSNVGGGLGYSGRRLMRTR